MVKALDQYPDDMTFDLESDWLLPNDILEYKRFRASQGKESSAMLPFETLFRDIGYAQPEDLIDGIDWSVDQAFWTGQEVGIIKATEAHLATFLKSSFEAGRIDQKDMPFGMIDDPEPLDASTSSSQSDRPSEEEEVPPPVKVPFRKRKRPTCSTSTEQGRSGDKRRRS